jgi:hypothetical protein
MFLSKILIEELYVVGFGNPYRSFSTMNSRFFLFGR